MSRLVKLGLPAILWLTPGPQQNAQDYLRGLAGQRLILRHFGGSATVKTKEKDLGGKHGGCDEAVEVMTVSLDSTSVTIRLRNMGTVGILGKNVSCQDNALPQEYLLRIDEFGLDQPSDHARKSIEYVLQTPEEFLAAKGVKFNPTPATGNESIIDLPHTGVTPPKPILLAFPLLSNAAFIGATRGQVIVKCVVGTDGVPRDPVVVSGPNQDLGKLAVDELSFDRLEPAHDTGGPVSVRMPMEMTFGPKP